MNPPQALRLHMRGCGNSGTWADIEFPAPHVMYLRQGWKSFARIHSLTEGLTLHFKLMESGLLSVKIFGHFGTRVRCCVESSSDDEDSSSSKSGEEDNGSDDEDSGRQEDGSSSGTGGPIIRVAGSLNFSGSPPWAAGVGRLRKRKRAGGKAVNSEYADTDAFVACWRPAASSSSSASGAAITIQPLDGHRDVLLVSSATRSSPRLPFCPYAFLFHFLRRGTRKGLRAPYLFLVL